MIIRNIVLYIGFILPRPSATPSKGGQPCGVQVRAKFTCGIVSSFGGGARRAEEDLLKSYEE